MVPSPFHGIFSSAFSNSDQEIPKTTSSSTPAPVPTRRAGTPPASPQVGQVAVDIFEHENYYIIKAPVAGVKLSDIDIEINDNVVTIRGTRRQTDTVADEHYYVKECFWGDFERSVTLPCAIDQRKVKATFNKDAILKIIVPKEERIKIVRISD